MTFRLTFFFLIIALFSATSTALAQVDSVVGQISSSEAESFGGGISGDGRFVVFESRGDIATQDRRNADGNTEIFLFDYAQRRIFQITDTKSVVYDTAKAATFDNIRILITNTRPVISNDGKWIAFSSNATAAYPGSGTTDPPVVSSTNPGSFDGNTLTAPTPTPSPSPAATPTPGANPLSKDANLEMWLYRVPAFAPIADLSAGDEVPLTQLAGGLFLRVTNTLPSQMPLGATATTGAFIADDNHDASISDDGHAIAFVSSRDLDTTVGNAFPADDTEEIYTYVRDPGTLGDADGGIGIVHQVTKNTRSTTPADPIYSKLPTISGSGLRVMFASTGDGPVPGMALGNPASSRNEEIFFTDLTAAGTPTGTKKQVTTTTPSNPGDLVNVLNTGRRMSRDGRYIVFDSFADLGNPAPENGGANYTSFATYLYDTTTSTFRRILARSDADSAATGGDLARYPGFTDNDSNGTPSTLVLETRMNIKADGTVAATAADGLNNITERPAQLYYLPLAPGGTFKRISKFPVPNTFLASTQVITSDSLRRSAFNLALSELGLGNPDSQSEVFYLLIPTLPASVTAGTMTATFATGASNMPISMTAVPTPTPTPTPSASPTPTPTPATPPAVFGMAPGMIAIINYQPSVDPPVIARTAVGSLDRRFTLPIELSGVSMTINGAAVGLRSVSQNRIEFVTPPALRSSTAGVSQELVLFNNGVVTKTNVTIVPARPDVFNLEGIIGPGGRTKVFNATNRVKTREPFTVRTVRIKPYGLVPTVLRVYLTGAINSAPSNTSIRIGSFGSLTVPILTSAVQVEPGVYTIDFTLPAGAVHGGDQPIIVTITIDGVQYNSRLDDTATRFWIL